MSMQSELLPCPFCGGEADHYASNESVFRVSWVGHITHCTKCQARVSNTDAERSIAIWNGRHAVAQPVSQSSGEPVAWQYERPKTGNFQWVTILSWAPPLPSEGPTRNLTPLYAHPAPAEIIERCAKIVESAKCRFIAGGGVVHVAEFQRAIEDALKPLAAEIRALAVVPEQRASTTGGGR